MNKEVQNRGQSSVAARRERPRRDVAPVATVTEREDAYIMDILLPGVCESDISLTAENRTLVIEALNHVDQPENSNLIREEFPQVRYRGVYELPDHLDQDIKAKLKNGVLRLCLPKREEAKPRKITVKAG